MKEFRFFRIYKENPAKEKSKIFLIIDNLKIELHDIGELSLIIEEKLQVLNFITKNDTDDERRTLILSTIIEKVNRDAYTFNRWLSNIIWEGHIK